MRRQLRSILSKISLACILLLNGGVIWGQWQHVGNPGFSKGSSAYINLKFHNNIPYVVFKDSENNYKVTMMKFNGSTWENVGNSASTNEIGAFLELEFHNNKPYIAFDDSDNNRIPAVMRFNGTSWESLPSPSANTAYDINLKSHNGDLYIAYIDFGADHKTTVKRFNGTNWETVGKQGFSATGILWLDLEFHDGIPYVAYKEDGDGVNEGNNATVMKFNGSDWEVVGERGFSNTEITYSNLGFYKNQPCMAFRNEDDNTMAVMAFNGNKWIDLSSKDFKGEYITNPELKVYKGVLYALYTSTGGKGRLKKYNGKNWENVKEDPIVDYYVSELTMNFLNNDIYVLMQDYSNSGKLSLIKHALPKDVSTSNLEFSKEHNYNIYPNPTKGILNIKTNKETEVIIYNIAGKVIYSSTINNSSIIDISSFNNGIYLVKLTDKDEVYVKRVIKN
jgi:hypothetical protein